RLIGTITAFTLAHSITLALSVFGLITLRSPPVEAAIALSIVLVASEALRDRDTLARRLPALVSFLFGLVHGLGFAGALKEIGLPQSHLPLALLCFNVGVEIGQLMVVLVAFAFVRSPLPRGCRARGRRPALAAIGARAPQWPWPRTPPLVFCRGRSPAPAANSSTTASAAADTGPNAGTDVAAGAAMFSVPPI